MKTMRRSKINSNRNCAILNEGHEDQMKIYGFRRSRYLNLTCTVLYFLTFGFLKLVFDWYPAVMVRLKCVRCSLKEADYIKLVDQYYQTYIAKVLNEELHPLTPENTDEEYNEKISVSRRFFVIKKVKYVWDEHLEKFEKLRGPHYGQSCSYFHLCPGLTIKEQEERCLLFGQNSIRVHVTPILKLLYTQGLNPFYIFQVMSCTLWFMDNYYYFAACIIIISILSLSAQVYQMRYSERKLKHAIGLSEKVSVFRRDTGKFELVGSESLAPGDIIEIPRNGCVLQCDAVLTSGVCIVNESMLTGESIPVTKTSVPDPHAHPLVGGASEQKQPIKEEIFKEKEHSRHILFCGTKVIQTRFYDDQRVTAVVMHTGFMTCKGELVLSILFPKPVNFRFTQDSYKFIACLGLIAAVGMVYTLVLMISRGETLTRIIIRTLDLITIVIPPSLPAAMTVGVVMAQKRLWESSIYCINSKNINLCGAVDCFCFDKTGTLTEDGLDLKVILPSSDGRFCHEVKDVKHLGVSSFTVGMATCHSLTTIDDEIIGDPVDLKMFEATDWVFDEGGAKFDTFVPTVVKPKNSPIGSNSIGSEAELYDYGILKQFTFSSKLQRMSVIVRRLAVSHCELYCKGSPEMIASLSTPESVPVNLQDTLMSYTREGYRVLALAHRTLKMNFVKIQRCQREQVERKLTFLGLMVFENQLKSQTKPVIHILNSANIRPVMVTGDNMLTALSVAKNCDMIDRCDRVVFVTSLPSGDRVDDDPKHFEIHWARVDTCNSEDYYDDYDGDVFGTTKNSNEVDFNPRVAYKMNHIELNIVDSKKLHLIVTGKSWSLIRKHHPHVIPKLLEHGTVFSRFSPDQKQQLIESLIEAGRYVGMCGDGANDCGALKAAHAGISLSEAESSVASPFTSKQANIECVPNLIREGRAALVTSFGIFKFVATYSLTQFTSVCLLYWVGANLTDISFLYIDMLLISMLSVTFSRTRAYPTLAPAPPRVSLLALSPILSIIVQVVINLSFQLFTWIFTMQQPWFEPYSSPPSYVRDFTCHEVTAVFCVSAFQYVTLAVVFSKGAPYRKTIFTNYLFMTSIIFLIAVNSLIALYPVEASWFLRIAELRPSPVIAFRFLLILLAVLNFFVSSVAEMALIDLYLDRRKKNSNKKRLETNDSAISSPMSHPRKFSNGFPAGNRVDDNHSRSQHFSNLKVDSPVRSNDSGLDDSCCDGLVNGMKIPLQRNFSVCWLPGQNEHKSLAGLMEAEQLVWDKLESSLEASKSAGERLLSFDISDDDEEDEKEKDDKEVGCSRKTSISSGNFIKRMSLASKQDHDEDEVLLIE